MYPLLVDGDNRRTVYVAVHQSVREKEKEQVNMSIEQSIPEFAPNPVRDAPVRRKQTREVLPVAQLAALRKIERLDYLLSACPAKISRRVMEVMDEFDGPEERVAAAVGVLRGEQGVGRDSDFVRACLASLAYCDEKELDR